MFKKTWVDGELITEDKMNDIENKIYNNKIKVNELQTQFYRYVIKNTATGESAVVTVDSAEEKLQDLKVFGKSTQDGEPTPEAPQEIKNVGKYNDETQKYDIDIAVNGKNLFKTYGYSCESINGTEEQRKQKNDYGTSINTTEVAEKLVITQKGLGNEENAQDYKNGYVCIGIVDKLIENKEYFFSADIKINSNPLKVTTFTVLANGIGSGEVNILNNKIVGKFIWKSYNERRYLELRNAGCSIEITNIMISYDSITQNSDYEPYRKQQTFTLSLGQPLQGIEECKDSLMKNGIVRKIKRLILDGSEDWKIRVGATFENVLQCSVILENVNKEISGVKSLCDRFKNIGINADTEGYCNYFGLLYISLGKTKAKTVEEFKNWLSQNKTVVEYEILEPVIEELPEEIKQKISVLHSNYPTTIISNDENAEMEVEYVADTKNYIDNKLKELVTANMQNTANLLSLMPLSTQAEMIENDTNRILENVEIKKHE